MQDRQLKGWKDTKTVPKNAKEMKEKMVKEKKVISLMDWFRGRKGNKYTCTKRDK